MIPELRFGGAGDTEHLSLNRFKHAIEQNGPRSIFNSSTLVSRIHISQNVRRVDANIARTFADACFGICKRRSGL